MGDWDGGYGERVEKRDGWWGDEDNKLELVGAKLMGNSRPYYLV